MSYRGGNIDDYLLSCQLLQRSCKSTDELIRRNSDLEDSLKLMTPTLARNSAASIVEEVTQDVKLKMDRIKEELNEREKFIVSMKEQLHLEVPKPDPDRPNNRLRQKYKEALRKDEKLEAEVQRSLTEVNVDMEKHAALLKQLHSTQVIEYLLMQDQIKESFKRDMDKLMKKFDAEMTRFRKDNSEVLAHKQVKEKNDSSSNSSTHQP
ncbi:uncharacterized protein [Drosophila kikkawai]|uniref:Uncharacterized protein n=1 Tax=Drosophila kikkawai TaxID=30033 RepID=A0A6P4HW15_DROKI|nr:uncharacterized protein LOC108073349 [Drosophila kikkawai]